MLSESAGRTVLKAAFEAQGYAIQENYWLRGPGYDVELDGYDPQARVGYEYLTSEDGVAPPELEMLLNQRECCLFLIDEQQVPDAPTLLAAAFEFLRALE